MMPPELIDMILIKVNYVSISHQLCREYASRIIYRNNRCTILDAVSVLDVSLVGLSIKFDKPNRTIMRKALEQAVEDNALDIVKYLYTFDMNTHQNNMELVEIAIDNECMDIIEYLYNMEYRLCSGDIYTAITDTYKNIKTTEIIWSPFINSTLEYAIKVGDSRITKYIYDIISYHIDKSINTLTQTGGKSYIIHSLKMNKFETICSIVAKCKIYGWKKMPHYFHMIKMNQYYSEYYESPLIQR
jgi:hypothetical protein